MKIRVGLLGLPNVGKSSCFNALAQQSIAQAANFPFCTIEPNVAPIAVPDLYLQDLGALANSRRTVPATMDWIDVAGLAQNAHRGEGLGNQFLGTLRECHALCHVIRVFGEEDDSNAVVHVDGRVDPVEDAEVIHLELMLADLEHVQRRLAKMTTTTTSREEGTDERKVLERIGDGLERGIAARQLGLTEAEAFSIKSMGLLTLKPVLYAFNVDEIDFTMGRTEADERIRKILESISHCDPEKDTYALVSAKMEADLSETFANKEEQYEYFTNVLGMDLSSHREMEDMFSYNVLPNKVRELLDLSVAYTGPGVPPERSRTTRAYLFPSSSWTAHDLAGRLHGDIQKGFIRAEVVSAPELLRHANFAMAKESGCVKTDGRNYLLETNDVVLIKWK